MDRIEQYRDIVNKKFEKYIVGYIDVLGYSKKVMELQLNNPDKISLEDLCIINYIVGVLSDKKYYNEKLDVRAFSDCVYVFAEKQNAKYLFDFLRTIQLRLLFSSPTKLEYGNEKLKDIYMVRGGITYGDVLKNNATFLGPAIIRAYEMESKIAKNPRIIIDSNAIEYFADYYSYICIDVDGERYIDYIKGCEDEKKYLSLCIRNIENQIADENDERVVEKLKWMKSFLLDENKEYFHI